MRAGGVLLLVLDEGEGREAVDPVSMVFADGHFIDSGTGLEVTMGRVGSSSHFEVGDGEEGVPSLYNGEGDEESWLEGKFAKLCMCLGMPMEGGKFEVSKENEIKEGTKSK